MPEQVLVFGTFAVSYGAIVAYGVYLHLRRRKAGA
jgi:hypothetical protein